MALVDMKEQFKDDVICPICKDIYVDPIIVSNCGHIFCLECINQQTTYPTCREDIISKKTPMKMVENIIKQYYSVELNERMEVLKHQKKIKECFEEYEKSDRYIWLINSILFLLNKDNYLIIFSYDGFERHGYTLHEIKYAVSKLVLENPKQYIIISDILLPCNPKIKNTILYDKLKEIKAPNISDIMIVYYADYNENVTAMAERVNIKTGPYIYETLDWILELYSGKPIFRMTLHKYRFKTNNKEDYYNIIFMNKNKVH